MANIVLFVIFWFLRLLPYYPIDYASIGKAGMEEKAPPSKRAILKFPIFNAENPTRDSYSSNYQIIRRDEASTVRKW